MLFATLALCISAGAEAAPDDKPILVTPDNFVRAESDLYFSGVVKDGGFGKFMHRREPTPIAQHQDEPRHALFSGGVRS